MPKQKLTLTVEVPKGWEAIDKRVPKQGEWFIDPTNGEPVECLNPTYMFVRVIIRRKLTIQSIEVTLAIPRGHKLVNIRKPVPGDYFVHEGQVLICEVSAVKNIYPIVIPT